jgi:hypothetical protein
MSEMPLASAYFTVPARFTVEHTYRFLLNLTPVRFIQCAPQCVRYEPGQLILKARQVPGEQYALLTDPNGWAFSQRLLENVLMQKKIGQF